MGKMVGNRFPVLDAADAPRCQSQHVLKTVLGMSHHEATATHGSQGLCPWVSLKVLTPSQDFSWPGLTRCDLFSWLFLQ